MSPAPDHLSPADRHSTPAPSPLPLRPPGWLIWLAAAGFAVVAALFAQRYLSARSELVAAREEAALTRVDAQSTRNLLEAERLLSQRQLADLRSARQQLAALERASDLEHLAILTLSPRLEDAPQARGIAVWSGDKQEGVLVVSLLPPLPADKRYRLWIIDPQYPVPVDAGDFAVDPKTGAARHTFKSGQPIAAAERFVVSLEPKDGATKPEGPVLLATP